MVFGASLPARSTPHGCLFVLPVTDARVQFKDVDAGDRIRLTVDKGGARLVEG